jgi:hypothetical protein
VYHREYRKRTATAGVSERSGCETGEGEGGNKKSPHEAGMEGEAGLKLF